DRQGDVAQHGEGPEVLVGLPELDGGDGGHVIRTSTSPGFTACPASTRTSVTVPGPDALNSFSIFIASITSSGVPAATVSPTATATCVTRPGIGAFTICSPWDAAAPTRRRRMWRLSSSTSTS